MVSFQICVVSEMFFYQNLCNVDSLVSWVANGHSCISSVSKTLLFILENMYSLAIKNNVFVVILGKKEAETYSFYQMQPQLLFSSLKSVPMNLDLCLCFPIFSICFA